MTRVLRPIAKLFKWLLIGVVGLIVAAIVIGNAFRIYGRIQFDREISAPGRYISIGTHRMHMHCVGAGAPTVVLDAGASQFSTAWAAVLELAEPITRVCAFDRSGMGWSEPSPKPVTAASRLADLEILLDTSGEQPPYIFTGWSLGGALAWLYAQGHMDQVAGVITVDGALRASADINEFSPISEEEARTQRIVLDTVRALGLFPALHALVPEIDDPGPTGELPDAAVAILERSHFLSKGLIEDISSIDSVFEAAREIQALGDTPLIVITHAYGNPGRVMARLFGEENLPIFERLWQEMQSEMSEMSSNGQLWMAESSDHGIPLQQPSIVVDAISEMVDSYRSNN